MVTVYSQLDGFPSPQVQPAYYRMLGNIGQLNSKPDTTVLVAISGQEQLLGGVVYFSDMAQYGSGGTATTVKNASGFRLLAVDPKARGLGVGKALSLKCIAMARQHGNREVVIHTTDAMRLAWSMYTRLGFEHSPDLDFMQEDLPVFGFRLHLT